MLDIRNRLTVLWDDNGVFKDISDSMIDYSRNSEVVELSATEDYLYVEFEKPINKFYVEMETPVSSSNTFTVEYYNGTSFTSVDGLFDESRGFTRSGFIGHTKPIDSLNKTLEEATTVNGTEKYFYRLRPSVDHEVGTTIKGINIVFSDDEDIKREVAELANDSRYKPPGETTHILQHESARDEILQKLKRWQIRKKKSGETFDEDITPWDLLDSYQVRLASTYLTISKIYFNLSDNTDDTEQAKSDSFHLKFKEAFDLYIIEIDQDDDGVRDSDDVKHYPRTHLLGR